MLLRGQMGHILLSQTLGLDGIRQGVLTCFPRRHRRCTVEPVVSILADVILLHAGPMHFLQRSTRVASHIHRQRAGLMVLGKAYLTE